MECEMKAKCLQLLRTECLVEDEAELTIKCGTAPDKCSRAVRLRKEKAKEGDEWKILNGTSCPPYCGPWDFDTAKRYNF